MRSICTVETLYNDVLLTCLSNLMDGWYHIVVGHSESMYTTEIGKYYKLEPLLSLIQLLSIYQHTVGISSRFS
jgi:hypothetical protein